VKRDDIIGKRRPIKVRQLDVPDWGPIFVRKLSAAEKVRCEFMLRENDGRPLNYQARFAVIFAADEDGNRIFTDADAETLGNDPAHAEAVEMLCREGGNFNSIFGDGHDEAKKNSENSLNGSSPGEPQ
jgi:hypothetical protein